MTTESSWGYDTEDEGRIIVSLGVVGSVLAYFALRASSKQGILPIENCDPNTPLIQIAYLCVYVVVAFFSIYLVLITTALGVSVLPGVSKWADTPRELADLYFGFGAVAFVFTSIMVLAYVLDEFNACKGASGLLFQPFVFVIGASLILAGLLMRRKPRAES